MIRAACGFAGPQSRKRLSEFPFMNRHLRPFSVLALFSALVFVWGCTTSTAPLTLPTTGATAAADVRLEVVKLGEFEAALAKHKGKVVLVDFWATFCTPCMKEFHRTVEMQQKYGREGLACISMSVDRPEDKDAALKFLQKEKAAFDNYLIDEKPGDWSKAWNFRNVPAIRVYGRDGKLVKQFDYEDPDNQFEHKEVEPFVVKVLRDEK
jgi:thiol-disulfide isomerase/thioredoxin